MEDQSALIKSLSENITDSRAKERFLRTAATLGRPTKYDDKMAIQAYALFCQGKSVKQVAADLGICRATYYNWLKDPSNKLFLDTHKKGKVQSQAYWDDLLDDNLTNDSLNFLAYESGYKRRHNCSEDSTVELPGFSADASDEDNIKAIVNGIADQSISPEVANRLTAVIKTKQEVLEIPQLKLTIDELQHNLKVSE